jgi:hypothetical protein
MPSDPGMLEADHIFVTSTEVGVFPRSGVVPVLDSIVPVSAPLGPPDDVVLQAIGSGFVATSAIAFGTYPDGSPRFEATELQEDGSLTTVITAGYFPNPDVAIPVLVGNEPPFGPVSETLTFEIGP